MSLAAILSRLLSDRRERRTHDFTEASLGAAPVLSALRHGAPIHAQPYAPCPSCGVLSRGAHACETKEAKEARSKPADRAALADEVIAVIKAVRPTVAPPSPETMIRERLAEVRPIRRGERR